MLKAIGLFAVLGLMACVDRPLAIPLFGDAGTNRDGQAPRATWRRVMTPTTPPPRDGHRMVYDTKHRRVLLFGGDLRMASPTSPSGFADDTWSYDGTTWTPIKSTRTPPPRTHAVMVYDTLRERVILFGGQRNSIGYLDDTWELVGDEWSEVKTVPNTPRARAGAAGAWDAGRGRLVMWGKQREYNDGFDGTWEYDGATWTQRLDAGGPPEKTTYPVATYDTTAKRVRMLNIEYYQRGSDLWSYDDGVWERMMPPLAPPLSTHETAMAYAPGLGLVQQGCCNDGDSTWIYEPSTNIATADVLEPRPRAGHDQAMVWDEARGCLVLFGGHYEELSDETWELRP